METETSEKKIAQLLSVKPNSSKIQNRWSSKINAGNIRLENMTFIEKRMTYLIEVHWLVETSQVAIVFSRLHIVLTECLLGKLQRGKVKVVSLLEKTILELLVMAVNGDLLKD